MPKTNFLVTMIFADEARDVEKSIFTLKVILHQEDNVEELTFILKTLYVIVSRICEKGIFILKMVFSKQETLSEESIFVLKICAEEISVVE